MCAAARAVVAAIREEELVERAEEMGTYLMGRLRDLATSHAVITEVRGRGLLVAIEVSVPSEQVVAASLARGLLVNNVQPHAVRFVPPLIVTRQDIDEATSILDAALTAVRAEAGRATAGR
jgi:4-aminobutyrate aminotransferase-like enzyme